MNKKQKRGDRKIKNLKQFVTFALASGISLTTAFAFAGCGLSKSEEEKGQEELFENAVAEVTECLVAVQEGSNFTLTCYNTDSQELEYYFKLDNDLVEYTYLGKSYYYYTENGVVYQIRKDDDGYWSSRILENATLIDDIRSYPMILAKTIKWFSYDQEEGVLSGNSMVGFSSDIKIENGEIYYKAPGGLYVFSDIGTTIVTLPENVIDNTSEDVISAKLAENDKVL